LSFGAKSWVFFKISFYGEYDLYIRLP
jgi:hypothetical protein